MKRLIIVLMLLASLGAVQAAEAPQLEASVLSYNPVPAEPGSYITVNVRLENDGDGSAPNAAIEFIDNYPFSVDDDRFEEIGELGSGEDYLAEYRVRIDANAFEGTSYIKVRHNTDYPSGNWFEKEIPLNIESSQKTVSITSVVVEPAVVTPGDQSDITLYVKNLGTSDLRDVAIKLNVAAQVVGTTFIDLPFGPIGSSIEKRISLLEGGESSEFGFTIQTYPTAEAGLYKIPVFLTYVDEGGKNYTVTDLISLVVGDDSDMMVQISSSNIYSDIGSGEVSFSLTNKGFSEVKFVTMTLEETGEYSIVSPTNQAYLGNIDSDDYEIASFEIKLSEETSKITLPVKVSFKDALNNEHLVSGELSLPLITSEEAGEGQSSNGTIIIVVLVVLIAGFIIYRRRKRRK